MELYSIIFLAIAVFFLVVGGVAFFKGRRFKFDLEKREVEMKRKMYELAILKELGERMGYSLNIQNIVDVIIGSLQQFIDYSLVSYMFLKPEEIVFKVHLEKSVSRKFIDNIKERMLRSLSALKEEDMSKKRIEEVLSGAILIEDLGDPVRSFFNIPLVIAGKVVGVLTIADVKEGLYKEEEMTILYRIIQQASRAVTKLEEVVKIEQRKLNAMVESLKDGILMTDKDYRVMVANPSSKALLNIPIEKEVTIFDFIDSLKNKFAIREKLEESIKLGKAIQSKEILFNDRYLQISVLPVKSQFSGKEQQVLGGTVVFHDITKEKEVEQMREDFTSMIAHELRSPLDGVKKIIEVLRLGKTPKRKTKDFLEIIYKNSSEMLELVSNLLNAAKIEAGKFEVLKRPSFIRNLVKGRLEFFEEQAKDLGIKIKMIIDKRVPQKINLDEFRIGQVLNNFISNALKFTEKGGKIEITVLLHEKDNNFAEEVDNAGIKWFLKKDKLPKLANNSLIIAVTDNGQGISQESFKELFSRFKQLKTKSDNRRGTGLGLTIAKGIVEAHKGVIGVDSVLGKGSTFYFMLPLTELDKNSNRV